MKLLYFNKKEVFKKKYETKLNYNLVYAIIDMLSRYVSDPPIDCLAAAVQRDSSRQLATQLSDPQSSQPDLHQLNVYDYSSWPETHGLFVLRQRTSSSSVFDLELNYVKRTRIRAANRDVEFDDCSLT